MHSSGRMDENVRAAIDVAERLRRVGCVPFVPHLMSTSWALVHPSEDNGESWMKMDLAWLRKCDAMVRITRYVNRDDRCGVGESIGTDREEDVAEACDIPVYYTHPDRAMRPNGLSTLLSDLTSGKLAARSAFGLDEYAESAMRTAPRAFTTKDALVCGAMGLAGEAGEFIDEVKKIAYHNRKQDSAKLEAELGDVLWYAALAARGLKVSLSRVAQRNIDKLRERYPDGFKADKHVLRPAATVHPDTRGPVQPNKPKGFA